MALKLAKPIGPLRKAGFLAKLKIQYLSKDLQCNHKYSMPRNFGALLLI